MKTVYAVWILGEEDYHHDGHFTPFYNDVQIFKKKRDAQSYMDRDLTESVRLMNQDGLYPKVQRDKYLDILTFRTKDIHFTYILLERNLL